MPINLFDGIVLGVCLFSAILAMVRGFTREVLSLASWALSAYLAYLLYPQLMHYAKEYTSNENLAAACSVAVIFLASLVVISIITMRVADFIIDSRIGPLDRTLGFIFGAARGVLIVVVAMLFFNWLVEGKKQPEWITDAKSKPLIDSLGRQLIDALPNGLDKEVLNKLKATTGVDIIAPAGKPASSSN